MYRVALVQNQSEMAHYGYADAQPLLRALGYEVLLYTAHNISDLSGLLSSRFDALFLASNSLNDKTIRNALNETAVGTAVSDFLNQGGGLLSMHQLGMSSLKGEHFPFLPDARMRQLTSVVRPLLEDPTDGDVTAPTGTASHILSRYPHLIHGTDLTHETRAFRSLPGIYWHWWEGVNLESWDTVLEDASDGRSRSLLIATKESGHVRAAFSAMTLDWQRQRPLLENLLTYIVEGRHSTAVLYHPKQTSLGFDYLLRTLTSQRFPYQKYALDANVSELVRYVEEGVHTSLVLAPHIEERDLPTTLASAITRSVEEGFLRLIHIDPPKAGSSVGSLRIMSRQRYALATLQAAEFRIQSELRTGYVDGSFWSTAEVLQKLARIKLASGDYAAIVGPTLEGIDRHERNGSYDGVFGATCAACWIRAVYLGRSHPKTRATIAWIRNRVGQYEDRERALAYTTFLQTNTATTDDRVELLSILSMLELVRLTQSDLVAYMQAALAANHVAVLPGLLTSLCDRRDREVWTDLATAAEASSVAQDVLLVIIDDPAISSELVTSLRPRVDDLVYSTLVELQDALDRSEFQPGAEYYPWDGKASTAVKCLETWLKLDGTLDLPVYEASEVLNTGARRSRAEASGETALSVLEELKVENDRLRQEAEGARARAGGLPKLRLTRRAAIAGVVLLLYVLASFTIGVGREATWSKVASAVHRAFIEGAPFHLAVLALIAGYAVLPWRRWLGRDET